MADVKLFSELRRAASIVNELDTCEKDIEAAYRRFDQGFDGLRQPLERALRVCTRLGETSYHGDAERYRTSLQEQSMRVLLGWCLVRNRAEPRPQRLSLPSMEQAHLFIDALYAELVVPVLAGEDRE